MSVAQAAFAVGMIGLTQFLPLFALTLVAGEAADRHDRRHILAVCYVSSVHVRGAGDRVVTRGWAVADLSLAALFGCSRAFFQPSATALGPMLVPLQLLPRAIATNSMVAQVASIVGPAFGGLLCVVSPVLGYAVSAGLYAAATASRYSSVQRPGRDSTPPGRGSPRSARGWSTSGATSWFSAPSPRPVRRFCRRRDRVCYRYSPETCSAWARTASACCERHLRSGPSWWPVISHIGRSAGSSA